MQRIYIIFIVDITNIIIIIVVIVIETVKPGRNSQIRSQTKATVWSRWLLRVTATYEIISWIE